MDARQAAELLLARRAAREDFVEYCRYMFPDEPPAKHHVLLGNALNDICSGKISRLIVMQPPGTAKSSYTSVRFPSFYLGKFPTESIICGSYGEGLATSFGRKVRNILATKEYQTLFPTKLSEDARAKGEWETHEGGSYYSCGVGSGITGRRAKVLLIDDPVKGRKEADSELVRNDTWDWYVADASTRLKPDSAQIIILTRWHEDDIVGRILGEEWDGESGDFKGFDGKDWKVICLPAEARENDILGRKEGEWLWPEYMSNEYWAEKKSVMTSRDVRNWNSLYQQTPTPDSGDFFHREWFKRYKLGEHPKLSMYGASDYAVSDGKGDFTEHGVGGFDINDDLYFVDWWSGQKTIDISITEQLNLADTHDPYAWVSEVGVIRRAIEPYLRKEMYNTKIYFRMEWLPHIGDKAANARAFQALAANGKVYIPECEWGDQLIEQLVKFIPNTNYKDDKVDVCGHFGRILDQAFAPKGEKPEKQVDFMEGNVTHLTFGDLRDRHFKNMKNKRNSLW